MSPLARKRYRRFLVACLYALAFIYGTAEVARGGNHLVLVVAAWAMSAAAALWATADASDRGQALVHIVQVIVFFSWPVSLPLYLIRSRGLRGAGFAFLHAAALFATYVVGVNVGLNAG